MNLADRSLGWRARHGGSGTAVTAQFEPGERRTAGGRDYRLTHIQCKEEALEGKRIGEDTGDNAPPGPM